MFNVDMIKKEVNRSACKANIILVRI